MAKLDTTKVTNRRKLRFQSLDDISVEVEQLEKSPELKTLGNWSAGQILKHLAIVMHGVIDGMELKMSFPMNLLTPVMRVFRKQKLLTQPMPAGTLMSKAHAKVFVPPDTSFEEGLAAIRSGLKRLKSETKRVPSPFMGKMTLDEWTQLQCRHCELHLSFLVPVEVAGGKPHLRKPATDCSMIGRD